MMKFHLVAEVQKSNKMDNTEVEDEAFEDEEEDEGSEDETQNSQNSKDKNADVSGIVPDKKNAVRVTNFNQKIVIINGQKSANNVLLTSLPHPKRNVNSRYIINTSISNEPQIQELQRFIDQPSSWFVGDNVQNDGSIFIATAIDPLFVLVKVLDSNRKKTEEKAGYFCEITQMLADEAGFSHFLHPISPSNKSLLDTIDLTLVCDVNNEHSQPLYRLNDDKLLCWLRCKVDRIAAYLSTVDNINFSSTVSRSAFLKVKNNSNTSKEDLLKYALGMVSEYISPSTLTRLAETYGFKDFGVVKATPIPTAPKEDDKIVSTAEKRKASDSKEKDKNKKPKLSVAQNRLAKTNLKGVSKINAFFSPSKQQ
mmetsp:Transcript_11819/g.16392  ORF Transcript_11819/g.16392 Transcript_11819/m.16392 type:complete len:367 (+) Transcript_11819:67-1167(+)